MGLFCSGFGWGGFRGWSGLGIVGLILNLVFVVGLLALLAVGTIWAARQIRRGAPVTAGRPDPLDIVRRRRAAGEITANEFEEIRKRLRS